MCRHVSQPLFPAHLPQGSGDCFGNKGKKGFAPAKKEEEEYEDDVGDEDGEEGEDEGEAECEGDVEAAVEVEEGAEEVLR